MKVSEYRELVLMHIKEEQLKHHSETAWDLSHMVMGKELIDIVISESAKVLKEKNILED